MRVSHTVSSSSPRLPIPSARTTRRASSIWRGCALMAEKVIGAVALANAPAAMAGPGIPFAPFQAGKRVSGRGAYRAVQAEIEAEYADTSTVPWSA